MLFKFVFFSVFSKNSKSQHFVLQISPWEKHLQKKRSIPRWCQRKILENCHLRFLIFETLSQRFFATKFLIIWKGYIWEATNILQKVTRFFCSTKKILSKFFVRGTKYTKMFGLSCSLFWHIDIENLLSSLKAAMVCLKTSKTEDSFFF